MSRFACFVATVLALALCNSPAASRPLHPGRTRVALLVTFREGWACTPERQTGFQNDLARIAAPLPVEQFTVSAWWCAIGGALVLVDFRGAHPAHAAERASFQRGVADLPYVAFAELDSGGNPDSGGGPDMKFQRDGSPPPPVARGRASGALRQSWGEVKAFYR